MFWISYLSIGSGGRRDRVIYPVLCTLHGKPRPSRSNVSVGGEKALDVRHVSAAGLINWIVGMGGGGGGGGGGQIDAELE